ncbi:transposase [Streptomyces sp. gb14]|uniref:transposase n=1 Tax=Streptomyces sp. gb14 TaxID=1827753 RepID=UPI0015CF0EB8|nr:transposase [Streptomyces sp. gb14]
MSVSRSTVLRLVAALPDPKVAAPRVVGVDEYATRKGRHYGTVLVDIAIRRPIDLLPDREASSLAAWLAENVQALRSSAGTGHRLRRSRRLRTAGRPDRGPVAPVAQPEQSR